jgi:general secretion pathway protein D
LFIRHATGLALIVAACVLGASLPATAQQDDQAESSAVERFERGMAAYEDGNYEEAVQHFRNVDVMQLPSRDMRRAFSKTYKAAASELNPEAAEAAPDQPRRPEQVNQSESADASPGESGQQEQAQPRNESVRLLEKGLGAFENQDYQAAVRHFRQVDVMELPDQNTRVSFAKMYKAAAEQINGNYGPSGDEPRRPADIQVDGRPRQARASQQPSQQQEEPEPEAEESAEPDMQQAQAEQEPAPETETEAEPELAQPQNESTRLYQKGLEAYQQGNYEQAVQHFRDVDVLQLPGQQTRARFSKTYKDAAERLNGGYGPSGDEPRRPEQIAAGQRMAQADQEEAEEPAQASDEPEMAETEPQQPPEEPAEPKPEAVRQLEKGMDAYQAGNYEQAVKVFRQIEVMDLPDREIRLAYSKAYEAAAAELEPERRAQVMDGPRRPDDISVAQPTDEPAEPEAPADADQPEAAAQPTAQQQLEQARRIADQDLAQAAALYRGVIESESAGPAVREQARAELAQVQRLQSGDASASEALDQAAEAIDAGRYEQARRQLQQVAGSEDQLGWFDRQRYERQQAVVQKRLAGAGDTEGPDQPQMAQAEEEPAEPQMPDQSEEADGQPEQPDDQEQEQEAGETDEEPVKPPQQSDMLQEARRAAAQRNLKQARQAEEEGQYQLAVRRYEQALQFAADQQQEQQIRQQLQAARSALTQQDGQQDLLQTQRERQELRRQAALAEFRESINAARDALQANNFGAASDAVTEAKVTLEQNRTAIPGQQYRQLRQEANELTARVEDQRQMVRQRRQAQIQQEQQQVERQTEQRIQRQQQQEIQRLLRRAQELRKDMKYDQALELVNEALFIDETNLAAQAMKKLIEQGRVMKESRELERRRNVEHAEQRLINTEATIPYDELIRYPSDWPELSRTRLESLETGAGQSRDNREIRQALEQQIPIEFDATQFDTVVDYFRNTLDINIVANWPALEDAGVPRDTLVDLQLENVPARQGLELVLEQVGARSIDPVDYSIADGVVRISTERDLQASTRTQVYDIRDLLVQVPNFSNAPSFDLRSALESGRGGSGSGGGTGGSSGGSSGQGGLFGNENQQDQEAEQLSRADLITRIITLIQDTVGDSEQWYQGAGSSIRELNGNLIIRTTSSNHREITEVLSQLRDTRAVQISVQARFLLVSDDFLEDIGVDLDMRINQSALDDNFGPIRIAQDSAGLAVPSADSPFTQSGQTSTINPGRYQPGAGYPSSGRSMDINASFMDNLEANLLVRATQADQRSLSLTAPRVTFFNGQRAYVTVARQITFISDLEPVPDAQGFDPTLGVVQSGVVLDVEGTVSADRRYVTLTLRPSLAEVVEIDSFTITGSTEVGGGGGGDDDEEDSDGEVVRFQGEIQAPELELTSIQSTVSIPDRGTLLLGGQRLVDEVEVEAGVPVLSKVPVINRLFTNTSEVQSERTLLILVKPNVIIQSERERERFPELPADMAGPQR